MTENEPARPMIYLASPYSHHGAAVLEQRFNEACGLATVIGAAHCDLAGISFYCRT